MAIGVRVHLAYVPYRSDVPTRAGLSALGNSLKEGLSMNFKLLLIVAMILALLGTLATIAYTEGAGALGVIVAVSGTIFIGLIWAKLERK